MDWFTRPPVPLRARLLILGVLLLVIPACASRDDAPAPAARSKAPPLSYSMMGLSTLPPGSPAPDFTLTEIHTGQPLHFAAFQKDRPVVLVLASWG